MEKEQRRRIGAVIRKDLIALSPNGYSLGIINSRGEVINSDQEIIGKLLPNSLIKATEGGNIIGKAVIGGKAVGWGCKTLGYVDKDGKVKKDGKETGLKMLFDRSIVDKSGNVVGDIARVGIVRDEKCNIIGKANYDGFVKNDEGQYIGCVNPDGMVINKEKRIGRVYEMSYALYYNGEIMGTLNPNGMIYSKTEALGCANLDGEVLNRDGFIIGQVMDKAQAYNTNAEFIDNLPNTTYDSSLIIPNTTILMNKWLVNPKKEVLGVLMSERNIIVDARGNTIGHLFADGYVYNKNGVAVDKFMLDGSGFYNKKTGSILPKGNVVDFNGDIIGFVSDDGSVVDILGNVYGKIDAKGVMFDKNGDYKGSVVKTGVGMGYDGSYLGYVSKSGKVIDVDGKITGIVSSEGHILNVNKQIIGEVIEENFVIDVLGNIKGYINALGDIIGLDDTIVTTALPGGTTNKNYSILKRGVVLDYSGNIIGQVSMDGSVISSENKKIGKVSPSSQVVDNKGAIIGEIVKNDIVINLEDKVVGYVSSDGKVINSDKKVIGRVISSNLVVDNNGKIMGHAYKIGANILSNDGKYVGRLSFNGEVRGLTNGKIGYLKSNGSYVNSRNQVSGYVLDEVAQSRRN